MTPLLMASVVDRPNVSVGFGSLTIGSRDVNWFRAMNLMSMPGEMLPPRYSVPSFTYSYVMAVPASIGAWSSG